MPRTRTRTTSPLPFRDSRVLFLLMAVGLVIGIYRYDAQDIFAASLQEETVTGCDGAALSLSGAEAELVRLHNEARGELGIAPLCVQGQLMAAARGHSEDMLSRSFYGHDTPEGTEPPERVLAVGYEYRLTAENIQMRGVPYGKLTEGEMEEAFTDWMQSPGHRRNILNPALQEVGIGVATGSYGADLRTTGLYTVDFGTPP